MLFVLSAIIAALCAPTGLAGAAELLPVNAYVSLVAPSLEQHQPIKLEATVGADAGFEVDATLTITEVGSPTPLCSGPAPVDNTFSCTFSDLAVGSHTVEAAYSGNATHAADVSDPMTFEVTPNTVHASGVGLQYTTFYPMKDGYRDTLAIKGNRSEAISVTARVYNSGGTRVKTLSAAAGSGAYSLTWTGRNSSGTIFPSGKYKVVQTLRDSFGVTKAFTNYVNLSKKKLVTHTKDVNRLGSSITAKGKGGTGSISISTTTGVIKLKGGSSGYAIAGWEMKLPSATIYKSLSFKVYAKSAWTVPANSIAAQNFNECARSTSSTWNDSCFDRWTTLGGPYGTDYRWYSVKLSPGANRSGAYVRGLAVSDFSLLTIAKARFTVVYQTLE